MITRYPSWFSTYLSPSSCFKYLSWCLDTSLNVLDISIFSIENMLRWCIVLSHTSYGWYQKENSLPPKYNNASLQMQFRYLNFHVIKINTSFFPTMCWASCWRYNSEHGTRIYNLVRKEIISRQLQHCIEHTRVEIYKVWWEHMKKEIIYQGWDIQEISGRNCWRK